MKRLLNYFLQGVVLLAPLAITIWACYTVFVTIDRWLGLPIPGAGFVMTIALITLFGFIASGFITRSLLALVEHVMEKLPFVRLLYSSTRDLLNAFVGEKRRFDRPVLVSVAAGGGKALGFVTQDSLQHLGLHDHVAVYFPQSYNFAGNVLLFPTSAVSPVSAASSDVMAFVVSGGVSGLEQIPAASPPGGSGLRV